MKFRESYDCIVLGDHPGALLGGCLAARQGFSVLFLPLGKSLQSGPADATNAQWIDPEGSFLPGLGLCPEGQGLLRHCLDLLGLSPSELALLDDQDPVAYQILMRGHRMGISRELTTQQEELLREFGPNDPEGAGFFEALRAARLAALDFWAEQPNRLTLGVDPRKAKRPLTYKDLKKKIENSLSSHQTVARRWIRDGSRIGSDSLPGSHSWNALLDGSECFLSSVTERKLPSSDLLLLLSMAGTGARVRGGLRAYRALLYRVAKRLGAHVPESAEVKRVFVERGVFRGVQVAHESMMLSGNLCLLGDSLDQIRPLLNLSGSKLFQKLKSAPPPSGWRFTLGLTVDQEAVPPGATRRMIWAEPGAPSLEIEVASPQEYRTAKGSELFVFARTTLPFEEKTLESAYQELLSARMYRQLTEIFPFLEFHTRQLYPDFRQSSRQDVDGFFRFKSLESVSSNLRVYGGPGVGSLSGVEGLFLSSGEAYPELGALGSVQASLEAVAWLAQKSGLKGPLPQK